MTQSMNVESQIKSIYPNLTKSERAVADYVIKHMDVVCEDTLARISQNARVGEATTMRFIYKLGYPGVAQFKLAIARENMNRHATDEDDGSAEYFAKNVNRLMMDTLRANDKETLTKVVEMIENAKRVYFFGNGTSGLSAEVAGYRFFRAGVQAETVTDTHMMQMKATLSKPDELIIAISLSGDNVDLVNASRRAKENNTQVVTISGHTESLLSRCGDVKLIHPPITLNERSYYGGMLGIIVQEFMIEMLFLEYEKRNHEAVELGHQQTTTATEYQHESLKSKGA